MIFRSFYCEAKRKAQGTHFPAGVWGDSHVPIFFSSSRLSRQNHVAADRLLNPMLQVRGLHDLKPGFFKQPNQPFPLE